MSHNSLGRSRSAGIVHQQMALAQAVVADRLREAEQYRVRAHVEAGIEPGHGAPGRLLPAVVSRRRAPSGKVAAEES